MRYIILYIQAIIIVQDAAILYKQGYAQQTHPQLYIWNILYTFLSHINKRKTFYIGFETFKINIH